MSAIHFTLEQPVLKTWEGSGRKRHGLVLEDKVLR